MYNQEYVKCECHDTNEAYKTNVNIPVNIGKDEKLAQAYVPFQEGGKLYSPYESLVKGTIYPELYRPYESNKKYIGLNKIF